jgi:hypothetical protein
LYTLLPGVYEYAFTKPDNTDVHAIFEAVLNKRPLERLAFEQAIARYPEWADLYSGQDPSVLWSLTPSSTFNTHEYNEVQFNSGDEYVLPESIVADGGSPRSITQLTPDKYIVLPLPDGDEEYKMRMFVALKPKRNATAMSDVLFDELEEVIMHGALQHLLVLPNKPWTDKELAAYHARQYTYQIAERRVRANLGNSRGCLQVRMQPFGA